MIGKWLFFFGLGIVVLGGIIWAGARLGIPLFRLPGEILIKGEKFVLYFPIYLLDIKFYFNSYYKLGI
ncbi:MAG: DUF2905 domain-containing protein [Chlamydiales bacterium]